MGAKYDSDGSLNKPQKCWLCRHAIPHPGNKCPWATKGKPVPGWTAKPSKFRKYYGTYEDTYAIVECPIYEEG